MLATTNEMQCCLRLTFIPVILKSSIRLSSKGLDPSLVYEIEEINRMDGGSVEAQRYSGDYLMTVGIPAFTGNKLSSRVYKLKAQ